MRTHKTFPLDTSQVTNHNSGNANIRGVGRRHYGFYIALLAMNHPAQVSLLIEISFQTLRDYAQYMVPNNNDNHHPSSNQSSSSSRNNTPTDKIHTHYIVVSSRRLSMMGSDVSSMRFVASFFLNFFLSLHIDPVPNAIPKKEWIMLHPTLMATT
mmetsp:Transcript_5561/g.6835  ORF Transcript_5561/g.6835 Transcript_5561/m.6835 type:complete len:155 (-) Transcript_5561:129-593(-)